MRSPTTLDDILPELQDPVPSAELFDLLDDTVFFIKDADGRYLVVNRTLVDRTGKARKDDLLGRTAIEVFGSELGGGYSMQDLEVARSGVRLVQKLELHIYRPPRTGWCLTTKLPLRARDGRILGLIGISRDLSPADPEDAEFESVAAAVRFARARLDRPPSLEELANAADMSVFRLDRRMKRLFGLSTGQWLLKTRIDHACSLLQDGDLPIAQVALEAGYEDQSAFSRQFRKTTGRTPTAFRALRRRGIRRAERPG